MLKITDITLRNFRSYEEFELSGLGDLTIIVGPNASGKTNAVEAIQLLTALSSFRSSVSRDLVRKGESFARAQIGLSDGNRELEIAMLIDDGKRTYSLNGKSRQPKDIRGTLPSVVFTPDDLELVKGSDKFRRRELDILGSQVNANYYQLMHDFEKVLRHKNKLLKDEAPADLLAATNELYIKVAEQLTNYREALFERMMPKIEKHYSEISLSREALMGEYVRSQDDGEAAGLASDEGTDAVRLASAEGTDAAGLVNAEGTDAAELDSAATDAAGMLTPEGTEANTQDPSGAHPQNPSDASFESVVQAMLPEEMRRQRSLIGPHLDKINFYIDGLNARSFASQGQQRSIVLALKLAEAEIIEELMDQLPVLLLDDVMSELDGSRREALVEKLLAGKQTFITTANINYFDKKMLDQARVVELGAI